MNSAINMLANHTHILQTIIEVSDVKRDYLIGLEYNNQFFAYDPLDGGEWLSLFTTFNLKPQLCEVQVIIGLCCINRMAVKFEIDRRDSTVIKAYIRDIFCEDNGEWKLARAMKLDIDLIFYHTHMTFVPVADSKILICIPSSLTDPNIKLLIFDTKTLLFDAMKRLKITMSDIFVCRGTTNNNNTKKTFFAGRDGFVCHNYDDTYHRLMISSRYFDMNVQSAHFYRLNWVTQKLDRLLNNTSNGDHDYDVNAIQDDVHLKMIKVAWLSPSTRRLCCLASDGTTMELSEPIKTDSRGKTEAKWIVLRNEPKFDESDSHSMLYKFIHIPLADDRFLFFQFMSNHFTSTIKTYDVVTHEIADTRSILPDIYIPFDNKVTVIRL
jgi:hypothetical protein